MSDTTGSLSRKISSAGDLQSVVRTMKALAASSIGQYEKSVIALGDYYHTVELGLSAHFRESNLQSRPAIEYRNTSEIDAVVFGSDQGLVGQFNDLIADYAVETLAALPGKPAVWAVGERVHARLTDSGVVPVGLFPVPNSVQAITPLVGQIQLKSAAYRAGGGQAQLYLFHNRPKSGPLFEPVSQRLLPLDRAWREGLARLPWPTATLPEIIGGATTVAATTVAALIREYLFISLFRACAESLASENASRLAAMQRAETNIAELLETLRRDYHRLRQSGIDEELFDVISGYEALGKGDNR